MPFVCCDSGVEAFRVLKNGQFLGVVSDMRTPGGVDGAQVHAWIARNRPDLVAKRVVFITGDYRQRRNCQPPCARPALPVWRSRFACSSLLTSSTKLWGKPSDQLPLPPKEDLRIRLLVVDDEQSIRKLCVTVGEALGFVCLEAESGDSALALLEEQPVHMILTDMVMPHMSGLEFLEKVKKLLPRTEVALMTGHGSIETAVQAMKLGAYDYITKPFSPLEELRLFLRRMAEKVRLVEENEFLRQRTDSETAVHGIVGSSAKIQEVLRMVSRLKDTRTAGADLRARAEPARSWSPAPFIFAALSPTARLLPSIADRWCPR